MTPFTPDPGASALADLGRLLRLMDPRRRAMLAAVLAQHARAPESVKHMRDVFHLLAVACAEADDDNRATFDLLESDL